MEFDKSLIPAVLGSVLLHSRKVLEEEAGIEVEAAERMQFNSETLVLQDITAIAGLGGPIGLLIAFSFEHSTLDAIYARMTEGLDIAEAEREAYRRDAAAETVNTILGACTADFQSLEKSITLSPPVIVEDARRIHRPKNAVFASMRLCTDKGHVGIGLVGPREMFDEHLNYQEQVDA